MTKVVSFYRGQLPNIIQIPGSLSQSWSSLWETKFTPLLKNGMRGVTSQLLCHSTALGILMWSIAHLPKAGDGLSGSRLFYAPILQVHRKIFYSPWCCSFPSAKPKPLFLLCPSSFLGRRCHHQWSSDLFLHLTFLLCHLSLNASENPGQGLCWQKLSPWEEMVDSYLYCLVWTFSHSKMLCR